MNYNKDDILRQNIMGIKAKYSGGTYAFKKLELITLNKLIENGFVNLEEKQNPGAPSILEFWELLKKYPDEPIVLDGYIVEPERDDYRISIDALEGKSRSESFIRDFILFLTHHPYGVKKIRPGYQYCWYD